MVNEIFLAIGFCNPDVFSEVELRIREKLSTTDETAIRFVRFQEAQAEPMRELSILRSSLDRDSTANRASVNVIVLFDGSLEDALALRKMMETIRSGMSEDGTRDQYCHLIWLVSDENAAKLDHPEIAKVLYKDLNSGNSSSQKCFDFVYLLSDKHQDLSIDASSRVDGASLLIAALLLGQRRVQSGFYIVGVGKRSISSIEMKRYARHKIAQSMLNGSMNHIDHSIDLFSRAFGENDLLSSMERCIQACVESEFCYVTGDGGSCRSSEPYLDEGNIQEIMENWKRNLTASLHTSPFSAADMNRFLTASENGLSDALQNTESQMAARFAQAAAPVKIPLLAMCGKKALAQAYNGFIDKRKKAQLSALQALRKKWTQEAALFADKSAAEKMWIDELLEEFCAVPPFVSKCEKQAKSITDQILQSIAHLDFERLRGNLTFCRENMRDTLAVLIDRCVDIVTRDVTDKVMIEEVPNMSLSVLKEQILGDLDRQSNNYMAAISHGETLQSQPDRKYYFMPESLHSRMQSSWDQILGNGAQVIIAEDIQYQNMEELVLHAVPNPMILTAFNTRIGSFSRKDAETENRPQNEMNQWTADSEHGDTAQPKDINPWHITVDEGWVLRFSWEEADVRLLSCQITGGDLGLRTLSIAKDDFMMKGFVRLDDKIGYGLHSIRLWLRGNCVSEYHFLGKRHTVEIQCEQSTVQLHEEKMLIKNQMTVVSVDGLENNAADQRICDNLAIQLGTQQILLPMPAISKKRQCWTIVREKSDYPHLQAANGLENEYCIRIY